MRDGQTSGDGPSGAMGPTGDPEGLPDDMADRRDVLIGRIVDGEASVSDWESFQSFAGDDPAAWRLLASQQRDSSAMRGAFAGVERIAERTRLPDRPIAPLRAGRMMSLSGFMRGSGWAVAAGLAIAWSLTHDRSPVDQGRGSSQPSSQGAGFVKVHDPDEALKAYLQLGQESGRVLGEMPQRVLLDSRQLAPGAGFEVIYVRPLVERGVVEDLLRFSSDTQDEFGRPVATPVNMPNRQSWPG